MDEAALLAAVARGHRAAMRTLYDLFGSRALTTAWHILRNDADAADVVQETFVEIWRRAADFDAARGSVRGWIVTIARTRAIDLLRKQRVRQAVSPPVRARQDETPSPAAIAETRQGADRLSDALAQLTESQREVVQIAYFEGLSQSETAARLDVPLGTIKSRTRTAMEKLAQLLVDKTKESP